VCPHHYLISVYKGVTFDTRVVIAKLTVSDHRGIFQELELEILLTVMFTASIP